ncbi:organization of plasma membrane [Rhodopirellula islandica]|uniref:Organization of plasma membrane n=1 Tax=Rhodopirellula islandica TaxID=595434 RepID=A0A0J1B2U0_RHOIS|nr:hypothetical protein [Rhodopirellula islandica]KLU01235.1 organization of plasma membrane [Rhodopirellula islandica]
MSASGFTSERVGQANGLGDWLLPDHSLDGLRYLSRAQVRFRVKRFWKRMFSPRQAIASLLSIAFVSLYLLAGLTLLSRREANDPEQLRLWLSGGMVLYAMYHTVKHLWAKPSLEPDAETWTAADRLWLGGGPVSRRTMVLREAMSAIPSALAKTALLGVVLWRDAEFLPLLLAGVCLALIALEMIRRVITHGIDALRPSERRLGCAISLVVGLAMVFQLGVQIWQSTPPGSDPVIYVLSAMSEVGHYAGSAWIQIMAFALLPAASVASAEPWSMFGSLAPSVSLTLMTMLAVAVILALAETLVRVDAWSTRRRTETERQRLRWMESNVIQGKTGALDDVSRSLRVTWTQRFGDALAKWLPERARGMSGLVVRQLQCVRRYLPNVIVSFAIPMALSLSPLLTDQTTKQWVFVIGGIALSSLLLAPPALQIDFRRDLKRMFLVRSLPLGNVAMCVGMLSVPVAITVLFQWSTLALGAWIAAPPKWQTIWLFMALPSLAVVTFAVENALFLAFPHHVHAQGIAMVIRAKITFLWKGVMLAIAPIGLISYVMMCERLLPSFWVGPAAFAGTLFAVWSVAALAGWVLVRCWNRFDPLIDTPPE